MEEERARKERRNNIIIKGWKILKKLIKTAVEEVLRKELKVVATRSFLDKNKYDNNKTQKQGEEKKNNNKKEEFKR